MSKHTPGKWKFYFNSYDPNNVQVFNEELKHVAWAGSEANAHLIAAAPELLDFAHQFAEYLENNDDRRGVYDRVTALIAKAEGREK